MNRKKLSFYGILLTILLAVSLYGCNANTPPSVAHVTQHFNDNYDCIQIIVEYLVNSGYEDVYIRDSSGSVWADFVNVPIADESVLTSIKKLLDSGSYIHISKIRNTIIFLQWRGFQDIGCGVAYSINGFDQPEVQYATELMSINEGGWYYYVSNYNEWRLKNR